MSSSLMFVVLLIGAPQEDLSKSVWDIAQETVLEKKRDSAMNGSWVDDGDASKVGSGFDVIEDIEVRNIETPPTQDWTNHVVGSLSAIIKGQQEMIKRLEREKNESPEQPKPKPPWWIRPLGAIGAPFGMACLFSLFVLFEKMRGTKDERLFGSWVIVSLLITLLSLGVYATCEGIILKHYS